MLKNGEYLSILIHWSDYYQCFCSVCALSFPTCAYSHYSFVKEKAQDNPIEQFSVSACNETSPVARLECRHQFDLYDCLHDHNMRYRLADLTFHKQICLSGPSKGICVLTLCDYVSCSRPDNLLEYQFMLMLWKLLQILLRIPEWLVSIQVPPCSDKSYLYVHDGIWQVTAPDQLLFAEEKSCLEHLTAVLLLAKETIQTHH